VIDGVLQDLGTGASVVLAEARDIAVSRAELDTGEYSIRFYGQSSTQCQHIVDQTYEEGDSAARTSPTALKQGYETGYLPVEEEVAAQASEPESYYRGCFCKVTHDFTASEVIKDPITGTGVHTQILHVNIPAGSYVTYAEMTAYFDDYARVYVNGYLVYDEWCNDENNTGYPYSCDYDYCGHHDDENPRIGTFTVENPQEKFREGDNVITFEVRVKDKGEGWLDYSITPATQQYKAIWEDTCNTPNGCASRSGCTLVDVQICDYAGNCIYTLRNGESTGKTSYHPARDSWIRKKRDATRYVWMAHR